MSPQVVLVLITFLGIVSVAAFAPSLSHSSQRARIDGVDPTCYLRFSRSSTTRLSVNFGWFTGSSDTEQNKAVMDERFRADSGRLGGVASMMTSIENLQTSQRYGKLTASLVNELAATTVEGVSPDGKVKVTLNAQQRPVGLVIDEAFFESSEVTDVKQSVLAAMEEAYDRSVERMDERMKSFYKEVGL